MVKDISLCSRIWFWSFGFGDRGTNSSIWGRTWLANRQTGHSCLIDDNTITALGTESSARESIASMYGYKRGTSLRT